MQRWISLGSFEQKNEKGLGSTPLVAVEVRTVSDALEEAAKEPRKLKDHVIVGLEQLLDSVKKQKGPNYCQIKVDLEEIQRQMKKMKADCVVMLKGDLKAHKEVLQKDKDFYESEVKRERDRNQITYQT